MQGRITKGTTLGGCSVNAGDIVECGEDTYRNLELTGDIEPVNPEVIQEPVHAEPEPPKVSTPAAKPKAKRKGK